MSTPPSPEPRNASSCAGRLKALADETRLAVVRQLMQRGECHVGDLQAALNIEQSLLSHHLRSLREAGIVQSTRDGKSMLYRLAPGLEHRQDGIVDLGCCLLSFEDRAADSD